MYRWSSLGSSRTCWHGHTEQARDRSREWERERRYEWRGSGVRVTTFANRKASRPPFLPVKVKGTGTNAACDLKDHLESKHYLAQPSSVQNTQKGGYKREEANSFLGNTSAQLRIPPVS